MDNHRLAVYYSNMPPDHATWLTTHVSGLAWIHFERGDTCALRYGDREGQLAPVGPVVGECI